MTRHSIGLFVPAFGLGTILFAGFFTLVGGSVTAVPLVYSLVGGAVIALLIVRRFYLRETEPVSNAWTFRWSVALGVFFAIQTGTALRAWIGGTAGIVIASCVAAGLGGLSGHLVQITLPQKRKDLFPPKLLPARQRYAAKVALWSLIAVEMCIFIAHSSSTHWPCAWLDVPRRLNGCSTILRNPSSLTSISYAPNGAYLAVAGTDSNVYLWSVREQTLHQTLHGHTDWVLHVAISPNGDVVASASWDQTIRLWRAADGALIRTLSGHTEAVWGIAFSPDGTTIASVADDKTVRLWRVQDGALLRTLERPRGAKLVAFAPDGQTLAVGGPSESIRLWNVQDGTLIRELRSLDLIHSFAFSPDGTQIAGGDWSNQIRLWRVQDGTLMQTLSGHIDHVVGVAWSPDGSLIASAGSYDDETVRVWRVADGTVLRSYTFRSEPDSLAFRPDGKMLAVGIFEDVYLWRVP